MSTYNIHQLPLDSISYIDGFYYRFNLSDRDIDIDIEEPIAERSITTSKELILGSLSECVQ